jgi:hypothetical protein
MIASVQPAAANCPETNMLKVLNTDQVRFIALLAKAGRTARDELLGNVGEDQLELAELKPARGEHNPAAALGFAPLAPDAPQIAALRDALASLTSAGRAELYALMRVGENQIAVDKLYLGLREAERLGDETTTAALLEDVDLHDHLMKGLYEGRLSS